MLYLPGDERYQTAADGFASKNQTKGTNCDLVDILVLNAPNAFSILLGVAAWILFPDSLREEGWVCLPTGLFVPLCAGGAKSSSEISIISTS